MYTTLYDVNGGRYPFHCFIADNKRNHFYNKPHWHYYIELLYFLEGNGSVILGNERFQVSEGDFVIINSRELHSITCPEGISTRFINILFDVDILYSSEKSAFEAKYILPLIMAGQNYKKVFRKAETEHTPIKLFVTQIYNEYAGKKYGFDIAVKINIGALFLWLIRNWEKDGVMLTLDPIPVKTDLSKFISLLDYLDQHYNEEITVDDMAKMCNVSYSYFSRFFKKVMKQTFVDYLNYIRITEAKKLLLTTKMNVTEVALNVGYSNTSYFIRQFKRYNKLSPKQFQLNTL
ncbi:MAG: Bifunctional transcriptional activator/DNA repair enzyme AdaA [Lachnoclostridium sp.]|jgi:AraC family transcriptional regulator, melibiose operon regulatory protein